MKKKHLKYILCLMLLLLLFPVQAQAAWKNTANGKIYTCKSKPGYYTGWRTIKGTKYYFNPKTGVMATGWQEINKKVYYFDSEGKMSKGLTNIGDATYLFTNAGVRQTGFQKVKINRRKFTLYFDENGKLAKNTFVKFNNRNYFVNEIGAVQYGYLNIAGKRYYADENTGMLACKVWIDNTYYFKADCSMAINEWANGRWFGPDGKFSGAVNLVGFIDEGAYTYYYSSNHEKITGFLNISGKLYYFAPEMKTGWFLAGLYRYFANEDGSIVKNEWNGKRYLLPSGQMATGWQTIGGNRYYFKQNGLYASGAKTIDQKRYVFDTSGVLLTNQWYKNKNKNKFYLGADGAKATGITKIEEQYYFFAPKTGALKTSGLILDGKRYQAQKNGALYQNTWVKADGKTYYATDDCSLAKGLVSIDGKIYYFNDLCQMVTKKKVKVEEKYYYLTENGTALISQWKKIKKKYYYFGVDGAMAVNTVVDGWNVSPTGERLERAVGGWQTSNGKKYYIVAGNAVTGLQEISGSMYYFNENGVMQTGIQNVDGKKYYFYSSGVMAKSLTLAIGDKQYTMNAMGVVTVEKTITVSGNTTGSKIAKYAIKFVGNPYVYGGTSLTNGADCSGFCLSVFANFKITLPRVADAQMHGNAVVVASPKDMLPGDLVFYGSGNYASHVGIYIGDGNIVHASNSQPYPAGGIKISNYDYSTPIRIMRYWS